MTTFVLIFAIIALIISIVIATIIVLDAMPYSNNDTICNIQMTLERITGQMFEMK